MCKSLIKYICIAVYKHIAHLLQKWHKSKIGFLSYGCYYTLFLRLYQSPKVSDSGLKIQSPGSNCVWKMAIDPSATQKIFSHFLKNEVFSVMPLLKQGCDMFSSGAIYRMFQNLTDKLKRLIDGIKKIQTYYSTWGHKPRI